MLDIDHLRVIALPEWAAYCRARVALATARTAAGADDDPHALSELAALREALDLARHACEHERAQIAARGA